MRPLAIVLLVLAGCGAGDSTDPNACDRGIPEGTMTCKSQDGGLLTWTAECIAGQWVQRQVCDYVHGYNCMTCPNGHPPVCSSDLSNPAWCD